MYTSVSIACFIETLVLSVTLVYQKRKLSYMLEFILHYAQELDVSCLYIVDGIRDTLGNNILGLFCDFSKVFEAFDRGIVLSKLYFVGIYSISL